MPTSCCSEPSREIKVHTIIYMSDEREREREKERETETDTQRQREPQCRSLTDKNLEKTLMAWVW